LRFSIYTNAGLGLIYKLPSGICIKVLEKPKKRDYERSRLLMCGMKYYLILSAAIDRTSPGTIYVDDLGEPHTAFIGTVEGYYALGEALMEVLPR